MFFLTTYLLLSGFGDESGIFSTEGRHYLAKRDSDRFLYFGDRISGMKILSDVEVTHITHRHNDKNTYTEKI